MPRKKKPKPTHQTYLFDIQSSKLDYMFSLQEKDKYFRRPFWEHVNLEIDAKATFPERIEGDDFKIYIMGGRELDTTLNNPEDDLSIPLGVGELTVRGDQRHYFGAIPRTSFWEIERRIKRGQLKAINLHGHALRYGSARIRSIDFAKEFDPRDF